jgi:hypothetical protein
MMAASCLAGVDLWYLLLHLLSSEYRSREDVARIKQHEHTNLPKRELWCSEGVRGTQPRAADAAAKYDFAHITPSSN